MRKYGGGGWLKIVVVVVVVGAGAGGVFETHVFGVVEVGGEELGGGEEFVFDHYIDVVVGEAFMHVSAV